MLLLPRAGTVLYPGGKSIHVPDSKRLTRSNAVPATFPGVHNHRRSGSDVQMRETGVSWLASTVPCVGPKKASLDEGVGKEYIHALTKAIKIQYKGPGKHGCARLGTSLRTCHDSQPYKSNTLCRALLLISHFLGSVSPRSTLNGPWSASQTSSMTRTGRFRSACTSTPLNPWSCCPSGEEAAAWPVSRVSSRELPWPCSSPGPSAQW